MVSAPIPSLARRGVLAQYWTTKLAWRGAYPRILTVSTTHLATFDPQDLVCTNQWPLEEIRYVEALRESNEMVIVFGKSRFRSGRLRLICTARSHFLALMETLRRHFFYQPVRFSLADMRRERYPCTEYFADGMSASRTILLTASSLQLVDEGGHELASTPFMGLQRIARSTLHEEGLILTTMYHERLFHCTSRDALLAHLVHAAKRVGVVLSIKDSDVNVPHLAARYADVLQHPAAVCLDVIRVRDDGRLIEPIQLVFQGSAMIEVHRKLRHVVFRPYNTLLQIIRWEQSEDMVRLQFKHEDDLVLRVQSRAQFIAILLLVCREAGFPLVELTSQALFQHRVIHPHIADRVEDSSEVTDIEKVLLRRLIRTQHSAEEMLEMSGAQPQSPPLSTKIWSQLRRHHVPDSRSGILSSRKQADAALMSASGLPDREATVRAMEELVTNLPCTGLSEGCDRTLLHAAVSVLIDHVLMLGTSRGILHEASTAELVLALRALTRVCLSSNVYLPEDKIAPLFDVITQLLGERTFLVTYWCLRLLQRIFEPRAGEFSRLYRWRVLDHFLANPLLLSSIAAILPTSGSDLVDGWPRSTRPGDIETDDDVPLLVAKEELLEKDLDILPYEAMFTLHYVLIYLHVREKQEQQEVEPTVQGTQSSKPMSMTASKTMSLTVGGDRTAVEPRATARPLAQIKRELAGQLLEKRQFLMDAMVDLRFAQTCRTISALLMFVLGQLAPASRARRRRSSSSSTASRRRGSSPLRVSALESARRLVDSNSTKTDEERQLDELDGFLMRFEADRSQLKDRSRLFQAQETILVPLLGFSQTGQTSTSFEDSYQRRASAAEDRLRLEHLEPCRDQAKQAQADTHSTTQRKLDTISPAPPASVCSVKEAKVTPSQPKAPPPPQSERPAPRPSSLMEHLKVARQPQPRLVVRDEELTETASLTEIVPPDDLVRSDLSVASSNDIPAPPRTQPTHRHDRLQRSKTDPIPILEAVPRSQPHRPKPKLPSKPHDRNAPPQSARSTRRKPRTCDACLCCNDVCSNADCFYCAEKEYQLQLAFPDKSASRDENPCASSLSSSTGERKYSSCEVRRHHSRNSCWIVVKGSVFDVTELVRQRSGKAAAWLQAVQLGKGDDMAVRKYAPEARRALEKCRLGEYYECERRTVLL